MDAERVKLMNYLIDSNYQRMNLILSRNNIKSMAEMNKLSSDELEEWERLNKINMDLTATLKKESDSI